MRFKYEVDVYEVYVFDCPACGGQTTLGDVQPSKGEDVECADCGEVCEVA